MGHDAGRLGCEAAARTRRRKLPEFELALGEDPLTVLGVTMPPWPGAGEATAAAGPWTPTV